MQWYNEPPRWTQDGSALVVTTAAETDFWRVTHYGFTVDNGHFYSQHITGDFLAEVNFSAAYTELYDQAGLMVRLDAENWLKCGVEYVDGVQQASVVVTREYSDWSVTPLGTNPAAFWLRLKRVGDAIEIFYSLDGATYTLLRIAYFPVTPDVEIGMMCCSPKGKGFEVTFTGFQVNKL